MHEARINKRKSSRSTEMPAKVYKDTPAHTPVPDTPVTATVDDTPVTETKQHVSTAPKVLKKRPACSARVRKQSPSPRHDPPPASCATCPEVSPESTDHDFRMPRTIDGIFYKMSPEVFEFTDGVETVVTDHVDTAPQCVEPAGPAVAAASTHTDADGQDTQVSPKGATAGDSGDTTINGSVVVATSYISGHAYT